MNAEPSAFDALFESVADGNPIDWPALEMASIDDAERHLLLDLSIVASVAEACGTQGDDGTHDDPGSSAEPRSLAGSVTRWGHLLLLEKIGEGHYAEVYRGRDVCQEAAWSCWTLARVCSPTGPLRNTAPAGTPLYLAPEVLIRGETTVSSDIYALGVLLYRLVTDTYPVMASSLDGLMAAHISGERRALRNARPDLPAGFVTVVDRALERNPSDRFPTSRAMEAALRSVEK